MSRLEHMYVRIEHAVGNEVGKFFFPDLEVVRREVVERGGHALSLVSSLKA